MSLPPIEFAAAASTATLAWAQDRVSRELVHIAECANSDDQRPLSCVGCGKPLLPSFEHDGGAGGQFLHPEGHAQESCLLRTAQAVVEELLQPGQSLSLPARTRRASMTGLSGAQYTVEVASDPDEVTIATRSPLDVLSLTLALDNGRDIECRIVGSEQGASLYQNESSYRLDCVIADPTLAGLSREALQDRLPDVFNGARWASHWLDAQLDERARRAALSEAQVWLDWDGMDSPLEPGIRRKTLLHREAAAILEESRMLKIPGWSVDQANGAVDSSQDSGQPARMVTLNRLTLQDAPGNLVPDILVQMKTSAEILFRIKVAGQDAAAGLTGEGIPVLIANFRPMAGFLTRAQFKDFVVHDLAHKRWQRRPSVEGLQAPAAPRPVTSLADNLDAQHRAMFRIRPEEWARRYLQAVADFDQLGDYPEDTRATQVKEEIARCAAGLAVHGYSEAEGTVLYDKPESPLRRLLVIRDAGGHGTDQAWAVLDGIINDAAVRDCAFHTVYLIAIKAFNPRLDEAQAKRVSLWRERVRNSVKNQEHYYLRNPRYDDLLGLMFPEMKSGLAHSFGKRVQNRPGADETGSDDLPLHELARDSSRSNSLPGEYFNGKREQELVWVHPLAIRVEIAKTIRGRMIARGEVGSTRGIFEEIILMTDEIEPWRFAPAIRERYAISKSGVLRHLYAYALVNIVQNG
jgi:hypothetical protein